MRKLCPNFDREDGLDTVLEVPIPEEMFSCPTYKSHAISWQAMKSWVKSSYYNKPSHVTSIASLFGGRNAEIQLLLGVVGAPLIPLPIAFHHQSITRNIKDNPIVRIKISTLSLFLKTHLKSHKPINDFGVKQEASMAKYIVQQYIAAVGGEHALNSIDSMYAMGKVKMVASEFSSGEGCFNGKPMKAKNGKGGISSGEMGSFVIWQKRPDLWCLEMMLSGCKISAGSDGKVAWRQTPWHHSHASRGPPRPLRRFLQVNFIPFFNFFFFNCKLKCESVPKIFKRNFHSPNFTPNNSVFSGKRLNVSATSHLENSVHNQYGGQVLFSLIFS